MSIHRNDIQPHTLVRREHLAVFALAKQAAVHEDAVQAAAYGPVQQQGSHAGIHAAGKAEYDFVVPEPGAKLSDCRFDETLCSPVAPAAADAEHEVAQKRGSAFAVMHFRVELYGPGRLIHEAVSRIMNRIRGAYNPCARRKAGNGISVAHPDYGLLRESAGQRIIFPDGKYCSAVFAGIRLLHAAASALRKPLRSVAYPENRKFAAYCAELGLGGVGIPYGSGTAGKDDSAHGLIGGRYSVERMNLAVNTYFAHSPCNQLGVLGSEIQYQNLLCHL